MKQLIMTAWDRWRDGSVVNNHERKNVSYPIVFLMLESGLTVWLQRCLGTGQSGKFRIWKETVFDVVKTRFCQTFYFYVSELLALTFLTQEYLDCHLRCLKHGCWFSSLLREVFLRVLQFSPLLKSQHFSNSNSILEWTDISERVLVNSLVLSG